MDNSYITGCFLILKFCKNLLQSNYYYYYHNYTCHTVLFLEHDGETSQIRPERKLHQHAKGFR